MRGRAPPRGWLLVLAGAGATVAGAQDLPDARSLTVRSGGGLTPQAERVLAAAAEPRRPTLIGDETPLSMARQLCGLVTPAYRDILIAANPGVPVDAPAPGRGVTVPACFFNKEDVRVAPGPGETVEALARRQVGVAGTTTIARIVARNRSAFRRRGPLVRLEVPSGPVVLPLTTQPVEYRLLAGKDAAVAVAEIQAALGAAAGGGVAVSYGEARHVASDPRFATGPKCGTAPAPSDDWPFNGAGLVAALGRNHAARAPATAPAVRTAVVAILDSGLEGLESARFPLGMFELNDAEARGIAGRDDDGNAHVDDVVGTNLYARRGPPRPYPGYELRQHGTYIAALARGGPGFHGRLAAPELDRRIRLLVVDLVEARGGGSDRQYRVPAGGLAEGLTYAGERGAHVVNLSLETPVIPSAFESALLGNRNMLVVAAAGNDGLSLGSSPRWPASYGGTGGGSLASQVVTVAAHDADGALPDFSARGGERVDLAAPGCAILSYVSASEAATFDGTSQATGLVSFVLALLHSEGVVRPADKKVRLLAGIDVTAALAGKVAGDGRMNAVKTLNLARDVLEIDAPGRQLLFGRLDAPLLADDVCPAADWGMSPLVKLSRDPEGGEGRVRIARRSESGRFEKKTCRANPISLRFTAEGQTVARDVPLSAIVDLVPRYFMD